jgi:diguanylate cyclase (GGDEF)-like protein
VNTAGRITEVSASVPVSSVLGMPKAEQGREAQEDTASQFPAASTDELEWLLQVCQQASVGTDSATVLVRLLEASAEHLECMAAALVRRNSPTVMVHSESADPKWQEGIRKLEGPLLKHAVDAWCDGSGAAGAQGTTRFGFRVLVIPLTSRITPGVLLFLRSPDARPFSSGERHLARHLSRQASSLLEAQLDPATGLHTRAAMQAHVERWGGNVVNGGEHCVVCVNIDRLHVINETAGFDAGDRVISEIAQLLQPGRLPHNAMSARIGGNEFAVALPHTDVRLADYLARALQASAAAVALRLPSYAGPVSLRCGIASFTDPTEFAHALSLAEVACKTAKDRGSGRVEIYSDADNSMLRRRTDAMTLGRLREALRNDRLTLYAQKIVPLSPGYGHTGYELLLRDLDDEQRTCAPAWLFSAAQRYQYEPTVDLWVIERAITTASRYKSELCNAQMSLSINISGKSLVDPTLMERVKAWVRQAGLAPGLLTFELIETAALSSIPTAAAFIRELRSLGCRFALDDFGIGVNSLQYLKALEADRVKIDGSFVMDVLTNEQSAATIRAIASLARDLRMETVGECADKPAIITRLQELGVDYVQGFAVHRPCPFEEVLENLRAEQSAQRRRSGPEM